MEYEQFSFKAWKLCSCLASWHLFPSSSACSQSCLLESRLLLGPSGVFMVRRNLWLCVIMVDAMGVWLNSVIGGMQLWWRPRTSTLCQISHFHLATRDFTILLPPGAPWPIFVFSEPENAIRGWFSASFSHWETQEATSLIIDAHHF